MNNKTIMRALMTACVLLAVTLFAWTLVHAVWYAPELAVMVHVASTTPQSIVSPDAAPVRLTIPAFTLDANIQHVGVNAKGNMGVPDNFTDVAWYKGGPAPGLRGSAVIDGHVDNGLGLAGVFKHLSELKVGDDVYVERRDGDRVHFKVVSIESYNYKEVPLERVFNRKDGTYLNLITCEGNWVKGEKTYDKRLIVYTKLVQ